jgi:predicted enzyme related to lactoylglutathione lyase
MPKMVDAGLSPMKMEEEEKAAALGARILREPFDVFDVARCASHDIPGVSRFAVVQDPQGAAFSVIKLDRIG